MISVEGCYRNSGDTIPNYSVVHAHIAHRFDDRGSVMGRKRPGSYGWKADFRRNRLFPMAGSHDKIIAAAAKRALQSLDLRRKGQSRLWLGDHGWWLAVVEFQPSAFQKGSYLNVAAHWLWSEGGYISFDLGRGTEWGSRVAEFETYVSDGQFQSAADRLAALAADEVQQLAQSLPSVAAAADVLMKRESASPPPSRGSWAAYHAGVAAGLADRPRNAEAMLHSVTDERVKEAADRFIALLPDAARFKAAASCLIAAQRQALRLPEMGAVHF